jgi:TPR repeat protein
MAPKGVQVQPSAVTDATYSLGWCLLYGVGTSVNYPEAIRLLTQVSKTHAGACYTLGVCHEEGRGVVVADDREAIKFYRKAQKLGHNKAAAKVAMLEKRLQNRSDAD